MHGLSGKKSNNSKPADEQALSHIHARVLTRDKSRWVKAAQDDGIKLTEWIIKKLNE